MADLSAASLEDVKAADKSAILPAMTQKKLDNQRDVVKNERRQRVDNQPYAKSRLLLPTLLYPPDHPYSWATIGNMADLSAASLQDVKAFFTTYYVPNNASLVIVGDFEPQVAKDWVKKYFGPLPAGPAVPRPALHLPELREEKRLVVEDNIVLPRLYYAWHTPAAYTPGDAELALLANILTRGKASRLFQALILDQHLALFLPAGPTVPRPALHLPELREEKRLVVEDNIVLPRLYYAWHTPAAYTPGDAELALLAKILTRGKSSRLYQALVLNQHLAQRMWSFQRSKELGRCPQQLPGTRLVARSGPDGLSAARYDPEKAG